MFQFTLPRGERLDERRRPTQNPRSFNSRSRVGSDASPGSRPAHRRVSIHAPAWGATRRLAPPRPTSESFNSRSRVGSDQARQARMKLFSRFQFTLPRGERPRHQKNPPKLFRFQFTLPRGERPLASAFALRTIRSFNSRSRVGSDSLQAFVPVSIKKFQFTLPRGERRQIQTGKGPPRSFNSRSRVGSDQGSASSELTKTRFNSRSRVGSDVT